MSCSTRLFKCNRDSSQLILGLILAGAIFLSPGSAQTPQAAAPPSNAPTSATPRPHSHYVPNHSPRKAAEYYSVLWGVDSLMVRAAESGSLIRFSYRVTDPAKAAIFNDKKIEAFLDSPSHGIRLVIPSLEKVGQLRQTNPPEAGKSYWMAFSNPTHALKRGDHVNVVIGRVHAEGLVVE
ncbi:MAG TPA: hypothetical protein VK747_23770 [Blastocatellia bacterium]|nr:hypothetical protein [Blastocatellia bacterium]